MWNDDIVLPRVFCGKFPTYGTRLDSMFYFYGYILSMVYVLDLGTILSRKTQTRLIRTFIEQGSLLRAVLPAVDMTVPVLRKGRGGRRPF